MVQAVQSDRSHPSAEWMVLQEAFQEFSKASATLETSYKELQSEARRLSDELANANAELQRSQRLQAMGEMAVELAHEIRNPLGSIELFASLLSSELDGELRLKQWADQIVTSVKFLNTIVTNMLTFTRSSEPQFQRLDLLQVLQQTLLFLAPVFQQRLIEVAKPNGPEVFIDGDEQMLRQMFINLMMNSLHAMPDGGRVSIHVHKAAASAGIDIEDSGIGIPEENLNRIFDPFFTTNEKGNGLGLAIVHQIVQKHHGSVSASSEVGKGTRFMLRFPAQRKARPC